jgi:hypothetical protein
VIAASVLTPASPRNLELTDLVSGNKAELSGNAGKLRVPAGYDASRNAATTKSEANEQRADRVRIERDPTDSARDSMPHRERDGWALE